MYVDMYVYKQLYSRYTYIAFCEHMHISVEAQLTLNKFKVYKTLRIQVTIMKNKDKKCAKQKAEVYFHMHICKHDFISDNPVVFRILGRVPRFPV